MSNNHEYEICDVPMPSDTIAQRVDSLRYLLIEMLYFPDESPMFKMAERAANALIDSIEAKKAGLVKLAARRE
jgi:hypothetical protein